MFTFFFYCVVIPLTILVPEVDVPKWGAIYIPCIITMLNSVGTPRYAFNFSLHVSEIFKKFTTIGPFSDLFICCSIGFFSRMWCRSIGQRLLSSVSLRLKEWMNGWWLRNLEILSRTNQTNQLRLEDLCPRFWEIGNWETSSYESIKFYDNVTLSLLLFQDQPARAWVCSVSFHLRSVWLPVRKEQLLHIPFSSIHHLHNRGIRVRWHDSFQLLASRWREEQFLDHLSLPLTFWYLYPTQNLYTRLLF